VIGCNPPIWVKAPSGQYPVYIGFDLLKQSYILRSYINSKQVFILSNEEVAAHYYAFLKEACVKAGARQIDYLLLQAGEQYKTLESVESVWTALQDAEHSRESTVITLGGGCINDMGGFSAACYMRGIPVIHFPTTLLAQVDAAIGGKTGVNYGQRKNSIGVFYQPSAVIADLGTLKTLLPREFCQGLAELIKYGIALDAALFLWLETNIEALIHQDRAALNYAVTRACEIKKDVVEKDEKENGYRRVLNFGHTVAHALESLLVYKLPHGEAVAIGMIVATKLSLLQGSIDKTVLERLILLLNRAKLPTTLPQKITDAEIWSKIKQDKKHKFNQMRWVLLNGLGCFRVSEDIEPFSITAMLT